MKVVMPMAGLGSRFSKVGIDTPKPLIKIKGKPMVKWAVESLPFIEYKDIIFIVRKEHVDGYKIDEELKKIFSNEIKIIVIDYLTDGAACTVLLAKEYINNDEKLIILDCDNFFKNNYEKTIQREDVDGAIPIFEATGTKWSFSKVDEDWNIMEVAEKKPISKYGNIGAFYFKQGKLFVENAEEMINNKMRSNNEFYIAPIYQILIDKGYKIVGDLCREQWGLGTPEDVKVFEERYKDE